MANTTVVNLRNSKYDVYIGRAGRGQAGVFGNPCAIGKPCPECKKTHRSGGDTIPCYRQYFYRKMRANADFRRQVHELVGKTLGCFCHPKPCHGQVMSDYLNWWVANDKPSWWRI